MTVIGGFLPIPLAMMIPFMGAQSLVIGKQFGEGFQYGKRKISAMTNEEFNKLTPMELAKNSAKELSSMIPSMQASIADMRDFQSFIVKELIATIAQLPSDIFTGAKTAFEGDDPRFERPFSEAFQEDVTDPLLEWLKKQTPQIQQAYAETQSTSTQTTTDQQFIGPQEQGTLTTSQDIKNQALARSYSDARIQSELNAIARSSNPNSPMSFVLFREQARRKKNKPTPKTSTEAIEASGQTGIGLKISTAIVSMKGFLQSMITNKSNVKRLNQNAFLVTAKKHNQLMQLNRKHSFVVDTAKSIRAKKLIFKT